jgi:hypothetical protein
MKAIKVQTDFSEWKKVEDFISEMNEDEDMVVYAIDNMSMAIATSGECSMAYVKVLLETWFNEPVIEIVK